MQSIHGEPSWILSNDSVELAVSRRAGHMAPVVFRTGGREFSPYSLSPWTREESNPELPELLRVLRGDFFCMPFGVSKEFPPHGHPANSDWDLISQSADELRLSISGGVDGATIEKVVSVRRGETAVYQDHIIRGWEGRYNYGNHPILDFSGIPEGQGRLSVSPFRWGSVYRGVFADPSIGEHGVMESGALFTDLKAVPLAAGGTTDVTRYPVRSGCEDLVMMVSEPATEAQPFAWSAAVMDGYVWFSLKNPADFPTTLFWLSNGGRQAEPWSSRHFGRVGIEEVYSHFFDGLEISREDRLAPEGIPTTREFHKDEAVSVRIVQGIVPVPAGFQTVASIVPDGPGRVTLQDENGQTVTAKVDWSYVL
ncbi:hypothetical protein [Luteolibacter sp. LG18]|uniref:hypothetical protein n=1 Tax=Luteolibacter sp. LG18 TaxID=2819286 RepID=UPI0030C6A867